MKSWDARRLAQAAGAALVAEPAPGRGGPTRASIDSRTLAPGELFVGLPGARVDGGAHAAQALAEGAWGALVTPAHAHQLELRGAGAGAVLAHDHPLEALQALARAWGAELRARGARTVAITGSTGKTSTKDILAALLAPAMRTFASPQNRNTEIGLPLSLLSAEEDVEAIVLEMAMRGAGQIAELTAIAAPDVGVIVNVGPAHIELLGSLEAVAAAKAELIAGLAPGASIVVPAGEPLLAPHLRADLELITFGDGGELTLRSHEPDGTVVILDRGEEIRLRPSFAQAHNLSNLLAAVGAARALGHTPSGPLEVSFSSMRGQRHELAGGVVLIDDCYNANPMSMRAAIADLAESAQGRSVAVLGDMLELGRASAQLHREIGEFASASGVGLMLAVGPRAGAIAGSFSGESHRARDAQEAALLLPGLLRAGDTVLVKGSRGVGLEHVAERLIAHEPAPSAARPAQPLGSGQR
jgi:UDP-N-acetylmuramoyl-tripeptide--D-alanyl-D-alanine ligase